MDDFILPLSADLVDRDPIEQFRSWFDDATKAQQPVPEAMALATAASDGRVSSRIVLLKGCDSRGFVFYTNYQSRKSSDLDENSWASLVFYWSVLHRQIRIEGKVARVSAAESTAYFATRPRGSQLGAWASPQSSIIESRQELERRLEEFERRFGDGPVPCPPHWGGFVVRPEVIEFWQGRENRLHDRVLYTRLDDGSWQISLLAP